MSTPKQPAAISKFFKEADVSLKKLEDKFLQLAQYLRKKRDIRKDDLKDIGVILEALTVAAAKAGLGKTATLTRHSAAFFEHVREHSLVFDRKMADLFGGILEALEKLMKNLREGMEESTDIAPLLEGIKAYVREDFAERVFAPEAPQEPQPPAVPAEETYLGVFLDETEQNIAHFNDDLVILEKNPAEAAVINNLFRIIHTIKGSSAMMNVIDVQEIAHAMENVLVIARENRRAFPEMFPLLFGGIDTIGTIASSLRQKKSISTDTASLIEKLKMYAQQSPAGIKRKYDLPQMAVISGAARELLSRALARQQQVYRILISLGENTPLKGMKAALVEEHLGSKGTVILMHPRAEEVDDLAQTAVHIGILFATGGEPQEIPGLLAIGGVGVLVIEPLETKELSALMERQSILTAPLPPLSKTTVNAVMPFIRIEAPKLDALMNLSEELVTIRARYEGLLNQMRREVFSEKEVGRAIAALKSAFSTLNRDLGRWLGKSGDLQAKQILKELDLLRRHLERLEETTAQRYLASEMRRIDETTGALGKVSSGIQATVMQARMVPIRGVFNRFNRIVRDMGKELGKDLTLVLEGEETELDRNLIDSIVEPIVHMVRNAISHGIEDTHVRRGAGKPPQGTITLRAFHQGNNVCIEVEDDGRGLDPQLLADQAVKKKLVSAQQVSRLTDREKLDLIFLPGFSTATHVTGISGRGVGMNAVRSIISAINGAIDIRSVLGRKTTFVLKIPLTLAIIQVLLVSIAEEIYAIPLESVRELMSVTQDMILATDARPAVRLRERMIPLVELKTALGVHSASTPENGMHRIMIVSDDNHHAGVLVDRFIRESEIVIKPLPRQFAHVKGISGATILGDGRIALILDPKVLLAD